MNEPIDKLVALHKADTIEAPPHLVQQWHDAIDQAASLEQGREKMQTSDWHPRSFLWGAAVSAMIAFGIGIIYFDGNEEAPVVDTTAAKLDAVPVSLTRGLKYHLRNSRQQLTDMNSTTDQTMLVMQIIEQNRLFETAADQNNAPNLARVLRAFEPILLQLAASDTSPADAEALRAQLAFELNVMLTKLAQEPSDKSHST